MKEYSKGIYVKFKPEEVEILHNRMKEAGVQNMSAYIRKMALNGYVIIPEEILHKMLLSTSDDLPIYLMRIENRSKTQQGQDNINISFKSPARRIHKNAKTVKETYSDEDLSESYLEEIWSESSKMAKDYA